MHSLWQKFIAILTFPLVVRLSLSLWHLNEDQVVFLSRYIFGWIFPMLNISCLPTISSSFVWMVFKCLLWIWFANWSFELFMQILYDCSVIDNAMMSPPQYWQSWICGKRINSTSDVWVFTQSAILHTVVSCCFSPKHISLNVAAAGVQWSLWCLTSKNR